MRIVFAGVAIAAGLLLAGCGSASAPSSAAGSKPKTSTCPAAVQADDECSDYGSVDWTQPLPRALKPQLVKALDIAGKRQQSPDSRFCQTWNGTHTFYENKFEADTNDRSIEAILRMIAFVQGAYGC